MATLQVVFLLISGCFLGHGPQISSAMKQQQTHKDVYEMLCKDAVNICPCVAKHLIVTETGQEQAKPWTCGSNVPLKRLTNLPTIKPPPGTKLKQACIIHIFNVIICKCGRHKLQHNIINLF